MDKRLHALAGLQGGVFSAFEAGAVGVDPVALGYATRAGELVRVRRGAYVDARVWSGADDDERYRLTVLAVARTRPGDLVSHHAALALHRLPLWQHDPGRIDLLSRIGQAVRRGGLHVHPRQGVGSVRVDGLPVVSVARAIVRSALTMGLECAVIAGDAALHAGLTTESELLADVAALSPHQGRGRAHDAVLLMDPKSESVGESRTRLILQTLGMGFESQYVIEDEAGRLIARVDFLVEGVVLEFDGRVKYRADLAAPGPDLALDPAEVVWLEKLREDRIRRRGYPVERVVWDDLDRPGLLGARLRAARPSAWRRSARDTRPGA